MEFKISYGALIKKNVLKKIFFYYWVIFIGMCNGRKILHLFLYNPMVRESGWITQSIHQTRRGAEEALEEHKDEVYKEWKTKLNGNADKEKFGVDQDWRILEYELLD